MSRLRRGDARADDEEAGIELEPMVGKSEARPELVALADAPTRNGFVRKVYGILGCQLVITALISGAIARYGRTWAASSPASASAAITLSSFCTLALALVFACCPGLMRSYPTNYMLLLMFTVAESVLLGFVCLQYTMSSVVLCAGLTGAIVLGLTIYALRTKNDFTGAGPYLFSAVLGIFLTGVALSLAASMGLAHTAAFEAIQVLQAGVAALVFSFYIVYDTQMMLGGQHQHEFSVDDYAMAAIALYLDIIQLFLALLRLLGREDDSGL
eukprot:TRINITY_DN72009_c0_g1_i1.p1 TRINITY_DN72009_c0_g1~~TRINITY_DN72009_c0_g1_i1.p1  ORF type:complete len:306 (-),score=59.30 TRINITY_DN72009_c0_g1_i1:89-901(-)